MAEPETKQRSTKMGSVPLHATQDEFAKSIAEEVKDWGKRLAEYNIRPVN
jgi:tripartite-type tricarboxylate transporter receptor subunit TctC